MTGTDLYIQALYNARNALICLYPNICPKGWGIIHLIEKELDRLYEVECKVQAIPPTFYKHPYE